MQTSTRSICLITLMVYTVTLYPATLVVTNLFDNNLPGTLRTTIANASSGDTIIFSVNGIIVLDPAKGELLIDKTLTIDGGNAVVVDGSDLIPACFHISGVTATDSIITNIGIQNFHNAADDGSAYGIVIDNAAVNCSVTNCVIENIKSGQKVSNGFLDAIAAGIHATISTGSITDNIIFLISSQDSDNDFSGNAFGVFLGISSPDGFLQINGDCARNNITEIHSGTSIGNNPNFTSGDVGGIFLLDSVVTTKVAITGDCSHNVISNLSSGSGDKRSGSSTGIGLVSEFVSAISSLSSTALIENNCSHNTITNLSSGPSKEISGACDGIMLNTLKGLCTYNTLSHLNSGPADITQGVQGINIKTVEQSCAYNTIEHLASGSATSASGSVIALLVTTLQGNCVGNTIHDVCSGASDTTSDLVRGIQISETIGGDCINNQVHHLKTGAALGPKDVTGIFIAMMENGKKISCNHIENLQGGTNLIGPQFPVGIRLEQADNVTIEGNTINHITGIPNVTGTVESTSAFGIMLGNENSDKYVTNASIIFNIINTIMGEDANGFGIAITGINSVGNDILYNSLFDNNGKAIYILPSAPVDALVTLNAVRCPDGCKLCIEGRVIPSQALGNGPFLIQFFASDTSSPEQAKIFIGEIIYDTSNGLVFKAKLSELPPIQAGQYLTATATALVEPHNNTSELSSALLTCMPSNTVCPCAPPKPIPVVCPAASCGDAIIL